ncbi:hypothetical protein DKX38_029692 [Salix brachista]|uniref:NET domain-containing protein n=1 Tax=Salix brachista TaxID=2182728 RepID=A0A5N5J450_9ROSI|nr:hypothetical protein DKX38_029692 [Salix brachista]
MKYNPEGQDVHVMAEQLLDIFETKWSVIKSDYDHEMRFAASYEVGIPTPTSRKNPFVPPPLDMRRILDRSVSMPYPIIDTRPKPITTTPSGRTPVPKKPKAKDPNKRDMTYDEKQKLSTNLQSLPSEKLDNIVQIIKKRSSALSQHDDEIEVDIDSVDVETLWELDRFVTNYKKSLSKNKRKAELAIQARAESQLNVQQKVPAPVVVEAPKETTADERNVSTLSPNHVEKQGDNGSRSSSSSSSSSDSGSSSSDSDSDSSSASGSDITCALSCVSSFLLIYNMVYFAVDQCHLIVILERLSAVRYVDDVGLVIGGLVLNSDSWCGFHSLYPICVSVLFSALQYTGLHAIIAVMLTMEQISWDLSFQLSDFAGQTAGECSVFAFVEDPSETFKVFLNAVINAVEISEFRVNAFWISILIRNLPLVYSEVLKATDCSDSAK